jgi:transposase
VWFAVLFELEVRGFTEDEELMSVDVSVRRGVAEVLNVGVQFVGKVINSHLLRHVVPFGPSTPMAQIRGAGSRTMTDTDLAWIDELLWLNGCNGVGLSLDDISVALRRERGVDVSAAALSRTFAQAALTKKRAQPRHYYKYTPENIEYYRKYVQHIFTTYVETRSAHRLRYLDESSFQSHETGPDTYWGPQGIAFYPTNHGARGVTYSVLGITATCPRLDTGSNARAKSPVTFDVLKGTMDVDYFTQALGEWWRAGLIERGDVIVMDNGKAHSSGVEWETIVEFFEDVGVTMIRLPVYSPELSPIELVWNQIKARLRRRRQCSPDEFLDVLKAEIKSVTYEDIKNSTASIFDTLGYSVT